MKIFARQEVPELCDLVGEGGRNVQVDGRGTRRPDSLQVR